MKLRKLVLLMASALSATTCLSHASLTNFTNYGYTNGTTASCDIFYGPNYLPTFEFETGTVGNPDNSPYPFTLTAVVPGYVPGSFFTYATGPVDSNGSTIPGNRELFYTFFASTVTFTITGLVTGNELDDFAFQALVAVGSAGGLSNVLLNGLEADDSGANVSSVDFWTWSDLNLQQGDTFTLTFETSLQHSSLDAFQIQTSVEAIPEPSTYALLALGLGVVLFRFRKRAARL